MDFPLSAKGSHHLLHPAHHVGPSHVFFPRPLIFLGCCHLGSMQITELQQSRALLGWHGIGWHGMGWVGMKGDGMGSSGMEGEGRGCD